MLAVDLPFLRRPVMRLFTEAVLTVLRSVSDCSVCTSTGLCEASQMAKWKAWSRRACSRGSAPCSLAWAASISSATSRRNREIRVGAARSAAMRQQRAHFQQVVEVRGCELNRCINGLASWLPDSSATKESALELMMPRPRKTRRPSRSADREMPSFAQAALGGGPCRQHAASTISRSMRSATTSAT